jgi:transcriptional regulator with XRE-family HTH domain
MEGQLLSPADVERLAAQAGLTLKEVCSRAGIAQSTFSRWRAGKTSPTLDVYERLREALRPDGAGSQAA